MTLRPLSSLLLLLAAAACAAPRFGAAAMLAPSEGAELPARFRDGLFLLQTRIGRDPRDHWLLLDTGTDRSLLDLRLCAELGLQPVADTGIVAATGAEVVARQLPPIPSLRCGAVEFCEVDAAAIDLAQLRDHAGLPIEGIAGCDLFRGCLLQIDAAARTVRILPRTQAPDAPPFVFEGRCPTAAATLAARPLRLLVDTGFQSLLAVPPEFEVPWRYGPLRTGELATLDGVADHGSGRVQGELRLGELSFADPWVTVAKGQPKLGMAALRRCTLTLDAAGGRLWIERRR